MRRWFTLWGPPLLLMAIIFFFSSQPHIPGPPNETLNFLSKKAAHALGYGLLAFSYARALAGSDVQRGRVLPFALLLAVLYAVSDEYHQTFTPNRTPTLLDVFIDFCGALVGLLCWQLLNVRRQLDASP